MAHFAFDHQSASVLSAWESSQRRPHVHRIPLPSYNSFPISPISPSSSSSSSSSSSISPANPWSPSSLSELELLQLRHAAGVVPGVGSRVGCNIAEREPCLPLPTLANHNFFDFDFSLPHLNLNIHTQAHPHPQHHQEYQQLPSPTSPSSSSTSSTLFSSPPPSSSADMHLRRNSPSASSSSSLKRSSSDDGSVTHDNSHTNSTSGTSAKKPRACMSMKDFVPPDVTGLSKREARLVKNRAAAFLSRQRKREEFELMEIRVGELERENARLREVAEGVSPGYSTDTSASELEMLRMQLAASRQREAELAHRLETAQQEQQKVKTEMCEPVLSDGSSSGSNSPLMGTECSTLKNIVANPKGGASLGLMVLLCALPSLLSRPSSHPRSTLPTSQSLLDSIQWDAPAFFPASAKEDVPSWGLGFPGANMNMDVDCANTLAKSAEQNGQEEWKKLELGLEDNDEMGLTGLGLGALDISFATHRTKDGKIRVRVHSSGAQQSKTRASASASSPTIADDDYSVIDPALRAFSLPSPAQSLSPSASVASPDEDPLSFSFVDADPLGPFLGTGSSPTGAFELGTSFDFLSNNNNKNNNNPTGVSNTLSSSHDPNSAPELVFRSDESASLADARLRDARRRRVRISLCSLPAPGGEGGEWEVEVR